jgi:2-polyprenyl-3-methyl-5-hydroxy-6-metoxy-1,4-benzoquinol methylase
VAHDSPYLFKTIHPDIRYVGLDVGDYNKKHKPSEWADEYLLLSAEGFLRAVQERLNQFDAVVSSHNLEHCADPDGVVTAMARSLALGFKFLAS